MVEAEAEDPSATADGDASDEDDDPGEGGDRGGAVTAPRPVGEPVTFGPGGQSHPQPPRGSGGPPTAPRPVGEPVTLGPDGHSDAQPARGSGDPPICMPCATAYASERGVCGRGGVGGGGDVGMAERLELPVSGLIRSAEVWLLV